MKVCRFILIAVFALSGCCVNHGDFTVLSNKIVNTQDFSLEKNLKEKNVTGTSMEHLIILFPTGTPTLTDALNDAFRKTDTDVMTDVTVESWFWWIPYIYGNVGWKVKGDAVKTRNN